MQLTPHGFNLSILLTLSLFICVSFLVYLHLMPLCVSLLCKLTMDQRIRRFISCHSVISNAIQTKPQCYVPRSDMYTVTHSQDTCKLIYSLWLSFYAYSTFQFVCCTFVLFLFCFSNTLCFTDCTYDAPLAFDRLLKIIVALYFSAKFRKQNNAYTLLLSLTHF